MYGVLEEVDESIHHLYNHLFFQCWDVAHWVLGFMTFKSFFLITGANFFQIIHSGLLVLCYFRENAYIIFI